MILGTDNRKMSKSFGNVINPDEIVLNYGADTLRIYEMFMGPLDAMKPWSTTGVEGSRRFLDRVYRLYTEVVTIDNSKESYDALEKLYHQTVKKVTEDIEAFHFNTAISQLMVFTNELYKTKVAPLEYLEGFVKMLYPFAPHMGEELWSVLKHTSSITYEEWPSFTHSLTLEEKITMVVQINGKIRDKIEVDSSISNDEMKKLALESPKIQKLLEGLTPKKVIVIPKKLVSIVL